MLRVEKGIILFDLIHQDSMKESNSHNSRYDGFKAILDKQRGFINIVSPFFVSRESSFLAS